jgi:hypothetical protein
MRKRLLIATILILACSTSAQANSVKWTLTDVVLWSFSGTSTAEGSFKFNADVGGAAGFSNVLIKTANAVYDSVTELSGKYGFTSTSNSNYIGLLLFKPMTNAGGSIDIVPFISTEGVLGLSRNWFTGEESIKPKPQRVVVKGSIAGAAVSLTEPATLLIFLMGALGIVMLRKTATI